MSVFASRRPRDILIYAVVGHTRPRLRLPGQNGCAGNLNAQAVPEDTTETQIPKMRSIDQGKLKCPPRRTLLEQFHRIIEIDFVDQEVD
jgi:hypothetical protein